MTSQEFRHSLRDEEPSANLSRLLQALWWDAKGDWSRAHEIAQQIETPDAAWVHAYLHRKEGDSGNARYWYGQAGKPASKTEMEAEWLEIADHLLTQEIHS
ncbi:hypothetical protein H7849_08230 [Alloacidobacterium dinghuense]|uniref:Uncharacterized protein n=1 Tax=Alloacidobacterium dinghuense TaxID=2763107 RepID=A0A7G8BMW2_9BACT|nr:hypothetical protein [Alloacidobacterium dinghuense]QNI33882.1 hypothetical protein H7849_08230 [Alloacidobacterium dinghuense]